MSPASALNFMATSALLFLDQAAAAMGVVNASVTSGQGMLRGGRVAQSDSEVTFGFENTGDTTLVLYEQNSGSAFCNDQCYVTLPPGAQQWLTVFPDSGGYANLNYMQCLTDGDAAVIYPDGTPMCAVYPSEGPYFGVHIDYSGVRVDFEYATDAKVTGGGSGLYQLTATLPSEPTCELPEPTVYADGGMRIMNIAGLEFGTTESGELIYGSYPKTPKKCDLMEFAQDKFNTVRLPFRLEFLKSAPSSAIDWTAGGYPDRIVQLVNYWTGADYQVLLDIHNYMQYFGGVIDDTALMSADQYASTWGEIATKFTDNPLVIFNLMNEPAVYSQSYDGTQLALDNQNLAGEAIRSAEDAANVSYHLILLGGNGYSQPRNWCSDGDYGSANSKMFVVNNITFAQPYAMDIHTYYQPNGDTPEDGCSSPVSACVEVQNPSCIESYAKTMNIVIGETGGDTSQACLDCLEYGTEWLLNNVTTSIAVWAGGSPWLNADGTTDYQLYVGEQSGVEAPQMLALQSVEGYLYKEPTGQPTGRPSGPPSNSPTSNPTAPTGQPTGNPTAPSGQPTSQPTGEDNSHSDSSENGFVKFSTSTPGIVTYGLVGFFGCACLVARQRDQYEKEQFYLSQEGSVATAPLLN